MSPGARAMVGGSADRTRTRQSSVAIVFITALLTYGYFKNDPGWNGFSRFDLVRALVEDGTTRIDRFHENTADKSTFRGHTYSDKAPGTSFLALPAYAAYFARLEGKMGRAAARNPDEPMFFRGLYLCSFAAVALPSAVALAFFFLLALELAGDRNRALFGTAALGLGSTAFPYSTILFGHQLCGSLLFLSFALLARERWRGRAGAPAMPPAADARVTGPSAPGEPSARLGWRLWPVLLSGLAAGYAVMTEFPAAVPAALIGLYLLRGRPGARAILVFVTGVMLPLILLAIYNSASFGNPLELGYSHVEKPQFAAGMSQGFMGLTYPKPSVLVEILFGQFRGLLPLSPVLVLFVPGITRMWKRSELRREVVLCVAIVGTYLLLNASYYQWDGGWSLGPRHTVPMLAFLALPVVFAFQKPLMIPGLVLLCISVGNMLIAAALGVGVREEHASMLFDFLYPNFQAGKLQTVGSNTNLGMALGLFGRQSLLPLLLLWGASAALLVVTLKRHSGKVGTPNPRR